MNKLLSLVLSASLLAGTARAADTLRVMTYNALGYGDHCQGANGTLHAYLKTIVQHAQPDILSLIKIASITTSPQDMYGVSPLGFGDSILNGAMNAAFPGRYAYAPLTNVAANTTGVLLFYNQQKLGFASIKTLVVNVEDFNLYKLYYKDPLLATTHDTTFLYVLLNHTESGNSSTNRDQQVAQVMTALKAEFHHLPNLISMGDFNFHASTEAGYQSLIADADTGFRFSDPPYNPDAALAYPSDYDSNPGAFAPYLTTSTRKSSSVPNRCGTSGGGKGWYDHIFISPWIRNNANYVRYIPGSYKTIGNDGHRTGVSINDNSTFVNNAAPSAVINALFNFSNKYPVMMQVEVAPNTAGISLPDPEINATAVSDAKPADGEEGIVAFQPVAEWLKIRFPQSMLGETLQVAVFDLLGRRLLLNTVPVNTQMLELPVGHLPSGAFVLCISGKGTPVYRQRFAKL